jgi:hypothetical protein
MNTLSIRGAPYAYARLNTVLYCRVPKKPKNEDISWDLKWAQKRPKKFVLKNMLYEPKY